MGLCGAIFRLSGYILVALIAISVYFHLECLEEAKNEVKPQFNDKFELDATDITTELGFTKKGHDTKFDLGIDFATKQWCPCAAVKLLQFLLRSSTRTSFDLENNEMKNLTILDARKHKIGDFHKTGFTLVELDEEPDVQDWRTNGGIKGSEDAEVKKFHKLMEPHLRKMYPKVKRFVWTVNVVRGGNKPGDQPTAPAPHLDYHQDDEARLEFHKDKPPLPKWMNTPTEPDMLMGSFDSEDSKLGVLLGVWKPIFPHEICDMPLAVMDATTFKKEFQNKNEIAFNFGFFTFNNLNGAIAHSPLQKWYYYSYQNVREVLVFHQYSKNKFFANPHTAFFNKNCPKDTQSRMSVEFRVGLFF